MSRIVDAELFLDSGRLRQEKDRLARAHLLAVKQAVEVTTRHLELNLEGITRRSVPGRLWRAWTSGIGPRGDKLANDPAGWVRLNSYRERQGRLSRTYGAMEFFSQEGRIEGKSGQWLAIPLPAAGSRGRQRFLTPGDWEKATGQRLRFVYRPGKPALLVADDQVLSGKRKVARGNTARRIAAGRGSTTVPIFVLVPRVDFANRFSIEPYIRRAESELAANARLFVGRIGDR
jgi:hypothetical protein